MLKITNLTNKDIDIAKNVKLKAHSFLNIQTSIDNRLYHLMNMGIIKIQEVKEKQTQINTSTSTSGAIRRQQMMERIKRGETKPSVSLDVSNYKRSIETKKENVKPGRKGRKNVNK